MTTSIPNDAKLAVVVSHPAHLLTCIGILLRWDPRILIIHAASEGPGARQLERMQDCLAQAGLNQQITSLKIDESVSFWQTIEHKFDAHLEISHHLFEWMTSVSPTHVIGDAYEASNFHHDLTRLMLDDAVKRYRSTDRELENLEFPLFAQLDQPGHPVVYGTFFNDDCLSYDLTDPEIEIKRNIVEQARGDDEFIDLMARHFPSMSKEPYRSVSPSRDYRMPPEGLTLYYDQLGQEVVKSGKYKTAINFQEHFLPLVTALENGSIHDLQKDRDKGSQSRGPLH